uniref:MARVEL domain-containing protein n=1 Tax=Lates calcarifer TaxID=8187 RepID=A0A4W6G5F8_LATCA
QINRLDAALISLSLSLSLHQLLSFVAFILEEVVSSCISCTALYFFEFVSCTAFLFTLLLLVLLSTTLHTRVGITCWPSLDFYYTAAITLLFFISSIVFAANNNGTDLEKTAVVRLLLSFTTSSPPLTPTVPSSLLLCFLTSSFLNSYYCSSSLSPFLLPFHYYLLFPFLVFSASSFPFSVFPSESPPFSLFLSPVFIPYLVLSFLPQLPPFVPYILSSLLSPHLLVYSLFSSPIFSFLNDTSSFPFLPLISFSPSLSPLLLSFPFFSTLILPFLPPPPPDFLSFSVSPLVLQAFGFLAMAAFVVDLVLAFRSRGFPWQTGGKPVSSNGGPVATETPAETEKLNTETNATQ